MEMLFGLILGLLLLGFIILFVFLWWRIIEKTGYHGALSLLMFVPLVNIGFIVFLALKEWPIHKQLKEGSFSTPPPLSKPAIVMIILGASIAPIIFFMAIAIPNLLIAKMSVNDALAKDTLRSISTAFESYAVANNGSYPDGIDELTTAPHPYLNRHYCDEQISGYSYTCSFGKTGYKVIATPVSTGTTGSTTFTIVTGGILTSSSTDTSH